MRKGMSQDFTLLGLLNAREERVARQEELTRRYMASLLCLRVNCPGAKKDTPQTRAVVRTLNERILREFGGSILHRESMVTEEGPVVLYCMGTEATEIKIASMEIEDHHPLGRFVDLDVYDHHCRALSRRDFGRRPRRCYLCERDAKLCAREGGHSQEELIRYMNQQIEAYLDADQP
ncbi:citrate lyase holo-[acyl-carrier protein] synthase [Cuneatibacter sp. NSJ-177]|uniref:citrate lyase holo-[acyl-carrier protein] synthase n=1 Tax=Cuneatibacter sp. NSJ-177 TaxID=2931401 RepID=UPI001FD38292|nr:citrate lyase holo-[acyl-carrier protein] synthase [Cuneatibacter sp. NSJ-177]MCJ7837536.1 citrate lyase holo-[acyl-carrier protein] synthase [Cuneatibacter sp. NSJ-177]